MTIVLLAVVGFGVARWWDKIAPQVKPAHLSINVDEVKKLVQAQRVDPASIPLLIGTNVATLVERSGIPAVSGVSDYTKETKDGKLDRQVPNQRLAWLGAHHHGQRRHGAE